PKWFVGIFAQCALRLTIRFHDVKPCARLLHFAQLCIYFLTDNPKQMSMSLHMLFLSRRQGQEQSLVIPNCWRPGRRGRTTYGMMLRLAVHLPVIAHVP